MKEQKKLNVLDPFELDGYIDEEGNLVILVTIKGKGIPTILVDENGNIS